MNWKFGEYQPDYNPKIHGTYDPARFYGKREYLLKYNIYIPSLFE